MVLVLVALIGLMGTPAMAETPGPPTGLAATQEAGLVALTWVAPEDDGGSPVLEYNILRGDSIENLTVMNKVGTGTTFTDTTASLGKTFFYAVSARNIEGNGNLSNIVSVEIPAQVAPTNPRTLNVAEDNGVVTLTWGTPVSDGGSPLTGYVVLRGKDPGNMTQLTQVGLEREYVDEGVKAGETYHYQVRAVNAIGPGLGSATVSILVPDEDDGDEGLPWYMYVAVLVIVVVLVVIGLMMRGKRGGPEASAPMKSEMDSDKSSTPAPTLVE